MRTPLSAQNPRFGVQGTMRARNCHMAHWIHDPRMSKVADPQQDLAWSPTPSSAGGAGTRFMVDPDHSFPRLASRSKEVAKWHNVHDLALTPTRVTGNT